MTLASKKDKKDTASKIITSKTIINDKMHQTNVRLTALEKQQFEIIERLLHGATKKMRKEMSALSAEIDHLKISQVRSAKASGKKIKSFRNQLMIIKALTMVLYVSVIFFVAFTL